MLVLSRKVGEKIVIGDNITVVVQRIGKGRVALAIEAPHDVSVLRSELAPFGVSGDEPAEVRAKSAPTVRQAQSDVAKSAPRDINRGVTGLNKDSRASRPVPPRLRQPLPDLLSGRSLRSIGSH